MLKIKIPSPAERIEHVGRVSVLPYLYSPFEYAGRKRFKCAGIASLEGFRPEWSGSIAIVEAKAPGSVVLACYVGDQFDAADLTMLGAEMAADHLAACTA